MARLETGCDMMRISDGSPQKARQEGSGLHLGGVERLGVRRCVGWQVRPERAKKDPLASASSVCCCTKEKRRKVSCPGPRVLAKDTRVLPSSRRLMTLGWSSHPGRRAGGGGWLLCLMTEHSRSSRGPRTASGAGTGLSPASLGPLLHLSVRQWAWAHSPPRQGPCP